MRPALPARSARALALQTALCLSLGLALPPMAQAQGLNAVEVWASWQEAIAATGGSLSAQEKREGMRLSLSDITLRPSAEPLPVFHLESLSLMGQADGSVAVQLPETTALHLDLLQKDRNGAEAAPARLDFTLSAPQLQFSILGLGLRPEVMFLAPEVTLRLDKISPELPAGNEVNFELALQNLGLRYKHDLASQSPSFDSAWHLQGASLQFTGQNGEGNFAHHWQIADVEASALGKFPPSSAEIIQGPGIAERLLSNASPANLQVLAILRALGDGMVIDLNAKAGKLDLSLEGLQAQEKGEIKLGLDQAGAQLRLSKEGFSGNLSLLAPALRTNAPMGDKAPRGFALSAEELGAKLSFGLQDLRKPQDWALAVNLRQIAGDETAWALFDPQNALPHDPVTLVYDSAGRYLANPAFIAPPQLMPPLGNAPEPEAPAPLERFDYTLSKLEASGLGLALSGKGAVTLDLKKPAVFGALPLPAGKLSFSFSGISKAIEKAVAMGVMTSADAIKARMSLPIFAKAAAEPDSFTTELDFRDESLYLNGRKIR